MKIRTLTATLVAALAIPALALAGASAMHPALSAKLLGSQETPAKGPAGGHGIVNLDLKAGSGKVCWTFSGIAGIGKPAAAHIHKASAGKAGPVVVPLGAAYTAKGCVSAAKPAIEAVESNPNAYYVNVHTAKYPNGAIRGQLVARLMHM
jgi:hypothetical protein